jgi:acetoin utilization deacetylase AcuC-like enzyme
VHDPAYIEAVRAGDPLALAESPDLRWQPGLADAAAAAAAGMVAAALTAFRSQAVAGSLSSGQHHAGFAAGTAYNVFNGLVLAARKALQDGARRVLIIDCDAHCGGGTSALIGADDRIWHLDVATHPFDGYTTAAPHTLDVIRVARDYLPTLRARLDGLAHQRESFDLCLYYAGMDPHEDCHHGGLAGIDRLLLEARERIVFDWCREFRIPLAFGVGGGNVSMPALTRSLLVGLHRLTVQAAVRAAAEYFR